MAKRRGSVTGPALIYALSLTFAALLPSAKAVNPAPDGGYPNFNTAEGQDALHGASNGAYNTAVGFNALYNSYTCNANTAVGAQALGNNASASNNTAIGFQAILHNTTGEDNTAIGSGALVSNGAGNDNTATGFEVLLTNTSGSDNTASGLHALQFNTTGSDNTATGTLALQSNTTGAENTATGIYALVNNTTGKNNTGEGSGALANSTTGSNNVAVGFDAGLNLTGGSNNIDLGANVLGAAGEANTIRIGKQGTQQKTIVAGIYGKTVASGVEVVINSAGQLGTVQSSARFKDDIKPMAQASEALLKLKPVTFRYKQELDPDKVPQFGLIAEEVEKVKPDLVVKDEDGKVTTVRYEAVNAMLLNEFLKEHQQVEQLRASDAEQKQKLFEQHGQIAQQQKQIEALAAAVQKVSDKVELQQATATSAVAGK